MKKKTKKKSKWKWPLFITILTFFISITFSYVSDKLLGHAGLIGALIILVFFILLGIVTDLIGMAVAAADAAPFHSMAANKVKGAKYAVKLVSNASKVTNILNDVVGDICGIIVGSTIAVIVLKFASLYGFSDTALLSVMLSGFAAALTVGGKAVGKYFALSYTNAIVANTARILDIFRLKR